MARPVRRLVGMSAALAFTAFVWVAGVSAAPPPISIVTGLDQGWPDVRGYDTVGAQVSTLAPWGGSPFEFSPYPTYQSGVRVAVGDFNGDGRNEIVTAPAAGAFTELRMFDGRTFRQLSSFLPFKNAAWFNGAYLAAGDTNGDGRQEVVEGLDAGCCTTVHVVDPVGGSDRSGFYPYGSSNSVGVRVAAADLDRDGKAEILAVPLGGVRVSVFGAAGGSPVRTFDTFGPEALSGASIAAGDVVGDARPELVAAAATAAGAVVKVIDLQSGALLATYAPFGARPVQLPQVAVADVNGDGRADIVVLGRSDDGTQVAAFDTAGASLGSFYVLAPGIAPGATLAAGDLNGDSKDEIVLGGGPTTAPWPPDQNGPAQRVAVYRIDGTQTGTFDAYPGLFQGGVRVALADVDGDGRSEAITAPGPGMEAEIGVFTQQWVNERDRGTRLAHFLAFESSFAGGASVAAGDVTGDGRPEIVVGAGPGRAPEVRVFQPDGHLVSSFLAFDPGYRGGISVAVGDLDADGVANIVAGTLQAPARIRSFTVSGAQTGPLVAPFGAGAPGVEVGVADIRGDGHALLLAAPATGVGGLVVVIEPLTGITVGSFVPAPGVPGGLRPSAADLDGDNRDEILIASGFGGDGTVRVFDGRFRELNSFTPYTWGGAGMNVAGVVRAGLPIAADARRIRLQAKKQARFVVARFHDAAGAAASRPLRAIVAWGDGTRVQAAVVRRGLGVYDVRGVKRYAKVGIFPVTVTVTDGTRRSIARSTVTVRR
jgi:VCBS repeat protein